MHVDTHTVAVQVPGLATALTELLGTACCAVQGALPPSAEPSALDSAPAAELLLAACRAITSVAADSDVAAPLARSTELAGCAAVATQALDAAAHPAAAQSLAAMLSTLAQFRRVAVLPDPDCPSAGGNAVLALPPDTTLPFFVTLLSSFPDSPEAVTTAATGVALLSHVPETGAHALETAVHVPLIASLPHSDAGASAAAATALLALACSRSACSQLAEAGVGGPLSTALQRKLQSEKPCLASTAPLLLLLTRLLTWHVGATAVTRAQQVSQKTQCGFSLRHSGDAAESDSTDESPERLHADNDGEPIVYELDTAFWDGASMLLAVLEGAVSHCTSQPTRARGIAVRLRRDVTEVDVYDPVERAELGKLLGGAAEALGALMEDDDGAA